MFLRVPVEPRAPTEAGWREVGARMRAARLGRLHQLVRQLTFAPDGASLFGDWDAATRHGLVAGLERAFLDPRGVLSAFAPPPGLPALRDAEAARRYRRTVEPHLDDPAVRAAYAEFEGKRSSFDDISSVDWEIDVNAMEAGEVGASLGKFQPFYEVKPWGPPAFVFDIRPDAAGDPEEQSLVGYRDYLRSIMVTAYGTSVGERHVTAEETKEAVELLNKRFKQDFQTQDLKTHTANFLAVQIMREILPAPAGAGYGLGVAPADIEPQGERTFREYLDYLIGLSGLPAPELTNRYRLDLSRSDLARSSAVRENIRTLQNFYSDTFECPPEPFPVVPPQFQGRVPFYLEYEEWLHRQAPFYPENFYSIKETYRTGYPPAKRAKTIEIVQNAGEKESNFWYKNAFLLEEEMGRGNAAYGKGQYAIALSHYAKAADHASWMKLYGGTPVANKDGQSGAVNIGEAGKKVEARYNTIRTGTVIPGSMQSLDYFYSNYGFSGGGGPPEEYKVPWEDFSGENVEELLFSAHHVADLVLPVCRSDVALALGDYPAAVEELQAVTGFYVYAADEGDPAGYDSYAWATPYTGGDLPYSSPTTPQPTKVNELAHPMELAFYRLRQGNAMLEWADALYRSDEPASVSRARELYKAVLWMYGEPPPIVPAWGRPTWWSSPAWASARSTPPPRRTRPPPRRRRAPAAASSRSRRTSTTTATTTTWCRRCATARSRRRPTAAPRTPARRSRSSSTRWRRSRRA